MNSMPVINRSFMSRYVLNFGGLDIFSNCVHSIYVEESKSYKEELDNIIRKVSMNYVPSFRIIEDRDYSTIDRYLMVKNFERVFPRLILIADLDGKEEKLFPYASFYENGIFTDKNISPNSTKWLDDYFFLNDMQNDMQNVFIDMLLMQETENFAFTLLLENRLIGQAFCTKQGNVFIVHNIVINSRYRGLGYSDRILKSILTYAIRERAEYVVCEISLEDEKSKKLFSSNYFELLYQAYYRVKNR